ncbi:MAG: cell division protein FtsL [Desulfobacterota bacterium]|nr:cell division protein FtsL [Thermodesulfobacteriota bacterium]
MDDVFTRAYIHTDVLGEQIVRTKVVPWKQEFKNYLLIVTTVVFCVLLFVWSRLEVLQMGYELSQTNKTYEYLVKENQCLRVEVASLKSPVRIEKIARERLGLINPKPENILLIP